MKIIPAHNRAQIKLLLASVGLPTDDIDEDSSALFYLVEHQSEVIGLIGMECFQKEALLRSLMVKPAYRDQGLGRQLVNHIQQTARRQGALRLYLLTTTASNYFLQQGFHSISRDETPEAIRATDEFSHICPASATIMCKELNT
ncbi:MAG: arsenic resistance N-acetyltransferase ArsN2 [Sedimenticola sp.]|nr:arsenic resistance N-acetyltransferase ArsN2 [Sedimenticola sp.]